MVSKYTTELVRDGVLDKIINLLNELDVSKEVSCQRQLGSNQNQTTSYFYRLNCSVITAPLDHQNTIARCSISSKKFAFNWRFACTTILRSVDFQKPPPLV